MCAIVLVPAVVAAVTGIVRNPTSDADLVLPLVAVVVAVAVAAYASVRRIRRAATRTTPGGGTADVVPLDELDRRSRRMLVETDDCVRTSREELGCAAALSGGETVRMYAEAVEFAAAELAQAFLIRQRLDDGEGEVRVLLEEVLTRCDAAGRRLDAEAAGFDQIRALERTAPEALEHSETRFRELTARVGEADGMLSGLRERYALSAYLPVAGHDEEAKDRLVFAMVCLNRTRQALDGEGTGDAVVPLRAAETSVDQATLLLDGVTRLASVLAAAAAELPAALNAAEADLAEARGRLDTETVRADLRGRITHGESVVAAVREETGEGAGVEGAQDAREPYDPVDALRRIEQMAAGLDRAQHRVPEGSRALARLQRALLVARGTVGAASDQVTAHRGAVGCEARTRLAEAERRLRAAENTETPPVPAPADALADAREAATLARRARQLAERDVRAYGTPYAEGLWTGGAVLGGILLDAPHRRGDRPGHPGDGGPASYGGPRTRGRRAGGELFRSTRPENPPPDGPGAP
ncbi:TPM domain-containing protein [Streptomyces chiangmaiensis]|uniref:TPM domain-containing protein n=1 Tax=Streptomyces chiangmaiensis TaxID=766497 RepID=A0ABU7FB14_9ACTN|nr:TPM domain-containing protein [Streptomyces chiangmaiensis]